MTEKIKVFVRNTDERLCGGVIMQVMERLQGNVLILMISGRLSFYSRTVFRAVIRNAGASGARHILVNLNEVTGMDSSALGFLALAQLNLMAKEIGLSLVAPPPQVKEILEQANFSQLIPTYDTEAQAITEMAFVLGHAK